MRGNGCTPVSASYIVHCRIRACVLSKNDTQAESDPAAYPYEYMIPRQMISHLVMVGDFVETVGNPNH